MAAGLTIQSENLEAFRLRLNELARRALKPEHLQPVLRLDAEVSMREITLAGLEELDRLKPMGQGNPAFQFVVRKVTQARPLQRMGAEKQHVKLWITDGSTTHEAVWWGAGKEATLPVAQFDLAFVPQINEYNNRRTIQLKVLDWQAA
jgi:single-stranded-DNA-specific exonuclease